jgi:hypothetical protein
MTGFIRPDLGLSSLPPLTQTGMSTGSPRKHSRPILKPPGALTVFVVQLPASAPITTSSVQMPHWPTWFALWIQGRWQEERGWISCTGKMVFTGAIRPRPVLLFAQKILTCPTFSPSGRKVGSRIVLRSPMRHLSTAFALGALSYFNNLPALTREGG